MSNDCSSFANSLAVLRATNLPSLRTISFDMHSSLYSHDGLDDDSDEELYDPPFKVDLSLIKTLAAFLIDRKSSCTPTELSYTFGFEQLDVVRKLLKRASCPRLSLIKEGEFTVEKFDLSPLVGTGRDTRAVVHLSVGIFENPDDRPILNSLVFTVHSKL